MKYTIYTEPVLEPFSLADLKLFCKLDSQTFDGNLTDTQCFALASHAIANNYTTHVGTGINVLGKQAIIILSAGTNEAGGTNDTKIQESDDDIDGHYTDWATGAFAQVTVANDNANYKKQYTGTKAYIRTVSKVLVAACTFGTSVLINEATTPEDAYLTSLIATTRKDFEKRTRRKLLTQTIDYYLNNFPDGDYITLPFGNLQSVTSIKYKDTAGTESTMTVTTEYLVETNGKSYGRIVLPYGKSWPGTTLYPSNPITIRFICGYTAAASIPEDWVLSMKMLCDTLYHKRTSLMIEAPGAMIKEHSFVTNTVFDATLTKEF